MTGSVSFYIYILLLVCLHYVKGCNICQAVLLLVEASIYVLYLLYLCGGGVCRGVCGVCGVWGVGVCVFSLGAY